MGMLSRTADCHVRYIIENRKIIEKIV